MLLIFKYSSNCARNYNTDATFFTFLHCGISCSIDLAFPFRVSRHLTHPATGENTELPTQPDSFGKAYVYIDIYIYNDILYMIYDILYMIYDIIYIYIYYTTSDI